MYVYAHTIHVVYAVQYTGVEDALGPCLGPGLHCSPGDKLVALGATHQYTLMELSS